MTTIYPHFRPQRGGRLNAQVEWLRLSKRNALAVPSEARKQQIITKYGADISDQIIVREERPIGVVEWYDEPDRSSWLKKLFGVR